MGPAPPPKKRRKQPPPQVPHESQLPSQSVRPVIPSILSQFITKPLVDIPKPSLSTDEQFKQYTAPISSQLQQEPATPTNARFYWKFACELDTKTRTGVANRPWYLIKEELERYYQLSNPKQQKKGLVFSSLLAYPWITWFGTGSMRRRDLFVPGAPAPLTADDVIGENARIIIVRLPYQMTSRLYKEVGPTLVFSEAETEAQRIDKISSFNYYAPASRDDHMRGNGDGRPPPSYRCHNCGKPGHWRQACKLGRRMAPKGIPKRFLEQVEVTDDTANTYVLEDGTTVRANFPNKGAL